MISLVLEIWIFFGLLAFLNFGEARKWRVSQKISQEQNVCFWLDKNECVSMAKNFHFAVLKNPILFPFKKEKKAVSEIILASFPLKKCAIKKRTRQYSKKF